MRFAAQNVNELDQAKYRTALYTICIGGNDLMGGILGGLEPDAIIQDIVPIVLYETVSAIEVLC